MSREIKVYDTRGDEVEISEDQLARHFKAKLSTLWVELGLNPLELIQYEGTLSRLLYRMVEVLREQRIQLTNQRDFWMTAAQEK